MSDDDEGEKVRYLDEIREPGEGWAFQQRFLALIAEIDDEEDRLVKTLRVLRMLVMPGSPLSEEAWDSVLLAAESVMRSEREPPSED